MSQGLTESDSPEPPRRTSSGDRSAIVVGADDVATDVASALADRSVAVTHYEDPIVAVKGYDGSTVDCVVLATATRGVNRIVELIANDGTVVVRLDAGDRTSSRGDLVLSPTENPRTIASTILDHLEDHAVDAHLARHDRLLRAVHDVTQAALERSDVGGVCTAACERLFESDCYTVTWITREVDGEDVVAATAGIEPSVLAADPDPTGGSSRTNGPGVGRRDRADGLVRTDRVHDSARSEACEGSPGTVTVTENAGYHTASVPLVVDGDRYGTLGLSTTQRIDAAERDVLEDLGTVLGERFATVETIVPPTPGEYGFGSPEAARTAMEAVQNVDLPPAFADVVDDYEDTFGSRDRFLWQWLHTVFPLFEFSCIEDEHVESLRTAKLATSMLVVVLDDLGEDPHHYATFQEAATAPFDHRSPSLEREGVDPEPVEFVEDVWDVTVEILESSPCYDEYAETFVFDMRQVVSAIEYAHHVNDHPRVGNVVEAEAYGSHNMMMFPAADIDLMYAPTFDRAELSVVRAVVHEAQKMGRIGNWLSTWERELAEGDVHAGTVLQALADDALDREDLDRVGEDPSVRRQVVDDIEASDSEAELLERWEDHYRWIHRRTDDAESVDLDAFLSGMVEVFRYHRASRGLK